MKAFLNILKAPPSILNDQSSILNPSSSILKAYPSILNDQFNILNDLYSILNQPITHLPISMFDTLFPYDDPQYLHAVLQDYLEAMGEEPISIPHNTLITEYSADVAPNEEKGMHNQST